MLSWRMQAEQKKRSKARKESQKAPSRFEEEKEKRGLLDKYDEEEEEAAMLIGDQGDQWLLLHANQPLINIFTMHNKQYSQNWIN